MKSKPSKALAAFTWQKRKIEENKHLDELAESAYQRGLLMEKIQELEEEIRELKQI